MHGPTFAPAPVLPAPPVTLTPVPRPRPQRPAAKPDPAAGAGANLVLTYLRLHWMMILFAGSLAAVGLAYLAYSLVPDKYESTAILRVASTPTTFTAGADPNKGQTAFATYIKTLRTILKSDTVLGDALTNEKYRLDRLDTIKAQADPLKWLDEKLDVTSPEGSELIYIRLKGDKPEDVKKIVAAVQAAFIEQVVDRAANERGRIKTDLERALNNFLADFRKRLGAIERSTSGFGGSPAPVVQAGGVAPPVGPIAVDPTAGAGPAVNPIRQASSVAFSVPGSAAMAVTDTPEFKRRAADILQGEMHAAKQALAVYPERIAEAKARLAEAEAKQKAVGPQPRPSDQAMAAAAGHPDVINKRRDALEAERAAGAFATARDQNAPIVRDTRARAAAARVAADGAQYDQAEKLESPGHARKVEEAALVVKQAADTVRVLETNYRLAAAKYEQANKELAAIHIELKKADEAKAAIDLAKSEFMPRDKVLQSMVEQMLNEELVALAPSRVQIQQGASVPRMEDGKKQVMAALAAAAAGFALVGLGAVGYEFRARKVSSLAELRAGGPNVVGVVPFLPDVAAADPLKRADVAEAIDKLRATVAQEWLGRGTATILVTSPLADEGKALTAYRLATSLAQAGTRTLLVDFDLRTPTLHHFAGVENTHGVADILRGEADPRSGQILLPGGLAFLPAGAWNAPTTDDPAGLPPTLGAALDPLLHKLRSDVDCLIVHGHSILTAADTVELARRSDAVLLCALYRETRMPLVKRAADRIAGMAGPAAGVVYIGATRHEALC